MSQSTKSILRCYVAYKRGIECLPDAFLLVIRLYWGWSFMVAGWGKLMNVGSTATYFASQVRGRHHPTPFLLHVREAAQEQLSDTHVLLHHRERTLPFGLTCLQLRLRFRGRHALTQGLAVSFVLIA